MASALHCLTEHGVHGGCVLSKVAHDNVARIYRSVPAAQIPAPADLPTSNPIKGAGKKAKG